MDEETRADLRDLCQSLRIIASELQGIRGLLAEVVQPRTEADSIGSLAVEIFGRTAIEGAVTCYKST